LSQAINIPQHWINGWMLYICGGGPSVITDQAILFD
jgi:hypothetical protein